ncbi:lipase [Granulicella sp. dw_53]|uniref:lipase n=1 Tax=Granulicella sp. dw_53 TaxID=2719792 RepID=UPI001BD32D0F|nr:lipase [Granulicella sp. dw_53]
MSRIARILIVLLVVGVGVGEAKDRGPERIPIVFVHGNGDDAAKWIGTIWLFESNGYPANRLYSIRFTNPQARTDDTKEEPFRSSTSDAAKQLREYVAQVIAETHSQKVALVGSSRGGMTIRNYLMHGGSASVEYAVLCGTPNHGVMATDENLNGEFNGKGPYLQALNHPGTDGEEVVAGVKMMTLRSDSLDKYAQPTGIGLGMPQRMTGIGYDGPALKGAENVVLAGLDHRELAFQPRAFAEMYRFITGGAPRTLSVTPEKAPRISGLVTAFAGPIATNQSLAGAHLRVYAIGGDGAQGTPVYEITTTADGKWGPMRAAPGKEYCFALEFEGRHVRYYKAPIPRSTALLNLRFKPAPAEPELQAQTRYVLIERPQGYFSRDRDPVLIEGKVAPEEPGGLPLRDAFLAAVAGDGTKVSLRGEAMVVRGSSDLGKDLPIVDFLW